MKKTLNIIFLTFVLFTSFVVFYPKDKLYYLLQEKLLAYNVTLESQKIKSNAFSLEIENSYVLLSGSKIASFKKLNLSFFGILIEDVKTLGTFTNTLPHAKTIEVDFGIGEIAVAKGDFGEILATLNLSNKKIIVDAKINSAIKGKYNMIFAKFKKVGDKYVYEFSF
ncbi:hypothetical protein [Sulfurimonas sp.]